MGKRKIIVCPFEEIFLMVNEIELGEFRAKLILYDLIFDHHRLFNETHLYMIYCKSLNFIIIFNKKNILELTDDFRKMISSLFFVKMFISMDEFINEEHWPITKLVMSDISSSHQNKQT